jgi:AraC-like DNA-binding protein
MAVSHFAAVHNGGVLIANLITSVRRQSERQQVTTLIDQCQALAGQSSAVSPLAILTALNNLVVQLPTSLSRGEHVIISAVLGHVLARLVRLAGIDNHADVTSRFLSLADAGQTMDNWRLQWFNTTECFAALLRDIDRRESQIVDARVARMLRFIQTRYIDPMLTMRQVAQAVNLCSSHAARLLRQHTGSGFHTHLHRCRILLAQRLLLEGPLSIKEIAAAVGYAHPSQFSRHFKGACRETPLAFRSTRSLRRLSA